jgi:hypothetical protein
MKPITFNTYIPCPETLSIQLNDQVSVYYWRVQDDKKFNLSNLRRSIDPLRRLHTEVKEILYYSNTQG